MSDSISIAVRFLKDELTPEGYEREMERLNRSAREPVDTEPKGDDRNRTGERGVS